MIICSNGRMMLNEELHQIRIDRITKMCIRDSLHASLLPKLRGGAPVHKAIINGDTVTGMSMMRMVKRMDAGAVMAQCKVTIDPDDTAGILFDKLAKAGADLMAEQLPLLLAEMCIIDRS